MEEEIPKTFTNRELWMLIDKNNQTNLLQHESLMKSQQDFHKATSESLGLILAQTSKTNGRVNRLESWKTYVLGGASIISVVIVLLVYIWNNQIRQIEKITDSIESQLEEHARS